MYVISGNHDDPSFFSGRSAFSNISFLQDYTLLHINGLNILLIGGAVSVDRSLRTAGIDYWAKEAFVYNEKLLSDTLATVSSLDIVVTHNAPTEFWPYAFDNIVFKFSKRDESLLSDLKVDRNNHSKLLRQFEVLGLLPKVWYYGHFHASYSAGYQGIKYKLLNSMELTEHQR